MIQYLFLFFLGETFVYLSLRGLVFSVTKTLKHQETHKFRQSPN